MADEQPSYWPRRTRARRAATPTNPHYPEVARRAAHRCEYCRAPEALFPQPFPIDHIVPRAWGGLTFLGNLALACPACNDAKRTTLGLLSAETGLPVWLFNPRGTEPWDRHFRVDAATGRIDGLTEVGRVTVECLKMNQARPLAARRLWILAGYYP